MRIQKIKKILSAFFAALICAVLLAFPVSVLADASIDVSTATGIVDISGAIIVNVTISADEQIGTYYVELEYDSSRMKYVSGAETEQDGILTLTGTGMSKTVRYNLNFTGTVGGEAGVAVRTALVNNSSGAAVAVSDSGLLEIVVTGQSDNSPSFVQKMAEERELQQSDLPVSGSIHDAQGNTYYVVDLTRTTPEEMDFAFDTVEEVFEGQTLTFATDKDAVLSIIPLMDSEGNVSLYAVNGDSFYPLTEHKDQKGNKYVYAPLDACSQMPQKIASSTEMWDYVVYGIAKDGSGGFYLMDENGNMSLYTVLNSSSLEATGWLANVFAGSAIPWERYLIIAAIVIIGIIILCIVLSILLKSRKKRKIRRAVEAESFYDDDETGRVDEDIRDIDVIRKAGDVESELSAEPASRRARHKPEPSQNETGSDVKVNVIRRSVRKVQPEEVQEQLSLDDIVLSEEEKMTDGIPDAVEKDIIKTPGTVFDTRSEPDKEPAGMGDTIRFETIIIGDADKESTEQNDDSEVEA